MVLSSKKSESAEVLQRQLYGDERCCFQCGLFFFRRSITPAPITFAIADVRFLQAKCAYYQAVRKL